MNVYVFVRSFFIIFTVLTSTANASKLNWKFERSMDAKNAKTLIVNGKEIYLSNGRTYDIETGSALNNVLDCDKLGGHSIAIDNNKLYCVSYTELFWDDLSTVNTIESNSISIPICNPNNEHSRATTVADNILFCHSYWYGLVIYDLARKINIAPIAIPDFSTPSPSVYVSAMTVDISKKVAYLNVYRDRIYEFNWQTETLSPLTLKGAVNMYQSPMFAGLDKLIGEDFGNAYVIDYATGDVKMLSNTFTCPKMLISIKGFENTVQITCNDRFFSFDIASFDIKENTILDSGYGDSNIQEVAVNNDSVVLLVRNVSGAFVLVYK